MHSSSSQRNWSSVSGQYCPMGRGASKMSLPMRPFRAAQRLKGLHTSCMHQRSSHRLAGTSEMASCKPSICSLPISGVLDTMYKEQHWIHSLEAGYGQV